MTSKVLVEVDDDGLGCVRGLIKCLPIGLGLWAVVIALLWMVLASA